MTLEELMNTLQKIREKKCKIISVRITSADGARWHAEITFGGETG